MSDPKLTAICPIFQVKNLDRGIDFYTRVMGFELAWKSGEPSVRASLCRDAIEIMLEVERLPLRSMAYIQVAGIDAYFERIAAAGAKVTVPLADRFYGMRDGRVEDADGNQLAIGEAIKD
jgi:uncharacterized glyoxalase superfamily protein PhnB